MLVKELRVKPGKTYPMKVQIVYEFKPEPVLVDWFNNDCVLISTTPCTEPAPKGAATAVFRLTDGDRFGLRQIAMNGSVAGIRLNILENF